MSQNTRWEDVLGDRGQTAAEALEELGLSVDSSRSEVAARIQMFCREVWPTDPREWMDTDEAEDIARDLLGDAG
jgi:hypothetical protein